MKKIFVLTVMFVATITFVTAQQRERQTPEERAKSQTERLEKLVTLTAEQKAKIEAINLDLSNQMQAGMESNRGDRDAMRAKMKELDAARDKKYKEVLTDEQFKKYSEDKAQREKEMEARRAQRNS